MKIHKSSSRILRFYCPFRTAVNTEHPIIRTGLFRILLNAFRSTHRPACAGCCITKAFCSLGRVCIFPVNVHRTQSSRRSANNIVIKFSLILSLSPRLFAGYILGAGMHLADIRWHQNAASERWTIHREFIICPILHGICAYGVLH